MAMTVRKDAELEQALRALAQAEGVSQQEVIRRAVLDRAARTVRRSRVDRLAAEAVTEWHDVLERLGDA